MNRHSLAATIVLVALATAPFALAQGTAKPKKKGTKADPAAAASATTAPDPTPDPAPPPPPPADSGDAAPPAKELPATPLEKSWDPSDTREDPAKRYYFVGARYRGDVIPKFLLNAFVSGGKTLYSNAAGIELDSRKDGFSTVFGLTFQNYSTGDILFIEKNKAQTDNNYSVINSGLNAIYASVDLLWSVPIDTGHHWDFEYGVGVGLGVLFGNLNDNWVQADAAGQYVDPSTGQHFSKCQTATPGTKTGCDPAAHTDPSPAKVGNYSEPAGITGPKPILFPMVNFPQLGLRYKPVKNFEARLGLGFSLTGFWFGLSGDYGLEKREDSETPSKPATPPPASDAALTGTGPRGLL